MHQQGISQQAISRKPGIFLIDARCLCPKKQTKKKKQETGQAEDKRRNCRLKKLAAENEQYLKVVSEIEIGKSKRSERCIFPLVDPAAVHQSLIGNSLSERLDDVKTPATLEVLGNNFIR